MTLILKSVDRLLSSEKKKETLKMKTRLREIILSCVLLIILQEIGARPNVKDGRLSKETMAKTKQDARQQKQTKLALREPTNNKQHGVRKSRISKPLKDSKALSSLEHNNKERKRQFIIHPALHALSHPYMFMRPPPMTQRTIVTTRIPRPPMAIPYNGLLSRGLYGGMHHYVSPFSMFDPMRMYAGGEEDEEGR